MRTLKNIGLAAAIALGTVTTAQAVTFDNVSNGEFSLTFSWDDVPTGATDNLSEFHTTTIGYDFDLTILEITGTNSSVGYGVYDSAGNLVEDNSFPFSVTTCSADDGSVEDCNLQFAGETNPEVLASGLFAGEYTFGFFGKTVPTAGTITFGVSKVSAVPVPAAGGMLLAAIAGFGVMRRRKRT